MTGKATDQAHVEEFLARVAYGEFKVFPDGQIWRHGTWLGGKFHFLPVPRLVGWKSRRGYLRFSFGPRNALKRMSVHRAVWLVYRGSIPEGYEVNHTKGDKSNNGLGDLELLSGSDNCRHAYASGLASRQGEDHNNAKLSEREVELIRRLGKVGVTQEQIAQAFDVSRGHVSHLQQGTRWTPPTDVGQDIPDGCPF